jgi:hypothetical protein
VPATSTTVRIDTRVTAHLEPGADGSAVDITDDQGTISVLGSGPVPAFIYERTPWADLGVTLFAGLAVTDGAWIPFWLYCAPDGTLRRFFAEHTDHQTTFDIDVAGTCTEVLGDWDMPIDVPAHELRGVALTCGFSVDDPSPVAPVSLLGSKPGTVSAYGMPTTVLVFSTVDCRTSCGSDSWFELHSVVWEPITGQVGFAIWYLYGEHAGTGALAANGFVFPSGGFGDLIYPNATWTLDR